MLTASPVTSRWPLVASPATTSPVFTPVRFSSWTPQRCLELCVQRPQRLLHRERRPHRTQRVVLVQPGQAEDGHDRVADVLLDTPAVVLEDLAHLVEVARHDLAQRLGVERLAQVRRALEVREDDRDRLPRLLGDLGGELGPAESAQAKARRVLLAAIWADLHDSSLGLGPRSH